MKINAPIGFFEIYKDFLRYGEGSMLCYYNGSTLNYVQFSSGNRKVIVDKELFDKYKKDAFSDNLTSEV